MSKKYLMLSMDGEEIESLAKVLGNKTCKKILEFLAEKKDASEKDIADAIKAPINTVEYNLKTLIESGLVEKSKTFFWSQKGKRIPTYKVSNKSIVISPKHKFSKLKAFLPTAIVSIIGALVLKQIILAKEAVSFSAQKSSDVFMASSDMATVSAPGAAESAKLAVPESIRIGAEKSIDLIPVTDVWAWFLLGALFTTVIFVAFNWRRIK